MAGFIYMMHEQQIHFKDKSENFETSDHPNFIMVLTNCFGVFFHNRHVSKYEVIWIFDQTRQLFMWIIIFLCLNCNVKSAGIWGKLLGF